MISFYRNICFLHYLIWRATIFIVSALSGAIANCTSPSDLWSATFPDGRGKGDFRFFLGSPCGRAVN